MHQLAYDFRDKSVGTLMRTIIPIIDGDLKMLNEPLLPFTSYEPLTDGNKVQPMPEYFDDASIRGFHAAVRTGLNKTIIPIGEDEIDTLRYSTTMVWTPAPRKIAQTTHFGTGGRDIQREHASLKRSREPHSAPSNSENSRSTKGMNPS